MTDEVQGDPIGRRIARRRAALLAEATRIACALEILLRRAGADNTLCRQLTRDIATQEEIEVQRGYGRIEPRRRFKKHSSQPLLDGRLRDNLYVDESGKSAVEPVQGPTFFALGAIAMPDHAASGYQAAADDIKRKFFGRTDITFHEPWMRNHEGPYYFRGDRGMQKEFDQAIDGLVRGADFVAFGVGVRKTAFHEQFVRAGIDPYLPTDAYVLAITLLLERYVDCLASGRVKTMGHVVFESQGPLEDAYHQLEYARILLEGSQWVPGSAFRNWLESGVEFTPKRGSDPMELADMLARELYEWTRSDCAVAPCRWPLFSDKIYCRGDGRSGKFGVKIFPDSDIRERIEAHRAQCGAPLGE